MPRRWLLLLGSNLAGDTRVRTALHRLAQFGALIAATPVRRFASHDGGTDYHNALVVLAYDADRDALAAAIRQLEFALGRRRGAHADVAIDIDILASSVDAGRSWQADPHAVEKGEFGNVPVASLLAEIGVAVEC